MKLSDANRLLDPTPMRLETGYERLPDGVLHIAVRTDLARCTGEMFEWWFRFRPDTQKYIWWHPVDHVFSDWLECREGTHIASIHQVEEFFTGLPAQKLLIQFSDPMDFFAADLYAQARENRRVSAAVCGRVGFGWDAPRDAAGRVIGGRLLHIGRDTAWGCALRSHFYIGQDLPAQGMSPQEVEQICPDEFGVGLLAHCYNEFIFLSRFLPSLFSAENRNTIPVELPW